MGRKLYILGDITEALYEQFTKELDELLRQSNKPIVVELSSQGGSQYVALAICGRLRNCVAPIDIHAYGAVMSAATIILASGRIRKMSAETWVMLHDSDEKAKGTAEQMQRQITQSLREEEQWAELLQQFTGTSKSIWRTLSLKYTYLSAAEALELNLIDEIMKEK